MDLQGVPTWNHKVLFWNCRSEVGGLTDPVNIRTPYSGSKAQDRGDSRISGL